MDTSVQDRRRAGRLRCDFPVLIHSGGRSLRATAVDISRVGILVRLPLDEVGLAREVSLAALGRESTLLLGDLVRADLHYAVLGTLIQHSARPVRLGRAIPGQDHLEVGLDFTEPVTDMEAEVLGLELPALRDDAPATWIPRNGVRARSGAGAAITVVVCHERDATARPLRIVPLEIDSDGVRADIGPISELPVLPEQRGAGGVLAMLAETYGAEPLVVILVESEPVWSGPARFSAVEVCPYDHIVRLQIAFPQLLSERAMVRLGVR